jgi:flagellar motility protein MotE (MotC chaperone)
MNLIRELRLLPIVLFATVCLLALKALGFLVEDRGPPLAEIEYRTSTFDKRSPASHREAVGARGDQQAPKAKAPWAKEMFNYPDVTGSAGGGAADKNKNADKPGDKAEEKKGDAKDGKPGAPPPAAAPPVQGRLVPLDQTPVPPGERALLERLQERRHELEARSRELEIRENLLKAAEHQLEVRIGELKDLEARMQTAAQQKDENEAQRFKSLVTMYENMKAKDAAKIFDRLELRVLLDVASQINPRRMSEILAQMQPEMAQRLTIQLANRANGASAPPAQKELPKIEGRPRPP